jgi:hypothetical protein
VSSVSPTRARPPNTRASGNAPFVLGLACGLVFALAAERTLRALLDRDVELVRAVRDLALEEFVTPVEREELVDDALEGMLSGLDAFSEYYRPDEIASVVSEEKDLVAACKRLIDRANDAGGPDNITVITARFDGEALIPPEATDPVGHRVFPLQADSGQTPAIELRLSGGMLTTGSISTQRRPTLEMPPPEPEPIVLRSSLPTESLARRRSRGTLIALMLLLLFLTLATWWVYRSAERIVEQRRPVEATNPATQRLP